MNQTNLPRDITLGGRAVTLRLMTRGDGDAILRFARTIAPHDLLFLSRDIRNTKVVAAWEDQIEQGLITSIIALRAGEICGCTALVRDDLSWSPHVAEIRVVTAADFRGTGLGRILAQQTLLLAEEAGVSKVFVRATVDQVAALAVFQNLGFQPEALLREHVRDADGATHDIVVLSLDLVRQGSRHSSFGFEHVA